MRIIIDIIINITDRCLLHVLYKLRYVRNENDDDDDDDDAGVQSLKFCHCALREALSRNSCSAQIIYDVQSEICRDLLLHGKHLADQYDQ